MSHEPELVRSALFVDFDNIYSGLREIDARAAERFAANPQSWLDWMEAGMPGPGERSEDELRRKILIRRCYLNPERFQRHRSDFTRAGFEVVDCPPLTRQGKTSTDIRMVMDILDTLRHETYFSEFILLSSDADFTPVLLRLRSMDRSTLTLTVGPAARAYRSACERVVDEVFFIEAGLGVVATMGAPLAPGAVGTGSDELFERMAASLRVEASARPTHEMTAAEIPPVYKRFPEFTSQSDWLGFFGLKPLTAHLTVIEPGLRIEEEPDSDWKWKLIFDPMAAAAEEAAGPRDVEADSVLLQHVTASVIDLVTQAKHPLDLATAANLVVQRLGTPLRESDWVGAGSFAALLKRLDLPGVAIDYPQANTPGFL
ncbi:MAG: NYN domain-containing protein, partial [Nitrospira sp.]|nr:NYN domain-containing protein [Nitrospira sp.]